MRLRVSSVARLAVALLALIFTTNFASAQSQAQSNAQNPSEPVITLHTAARMVTVDVVAKDSKGRPATGLTAKDFQIFEQSSGWRKEKREQKIAAFRALGITELVEQDPGKVKLPPGVFTNLVTLEKQPVPPTILLVDGLNTELTVQMQVHAQMVKMLRSLPPDVPVAVFLLGHRLRMLQSFTTDPALLQAALGKATTAEVGNIGQVDPRDDPDSLSNIAATMPHASEGLVQSLQRFEQETYATAIDARVQGTVEALVSIARHVAGYPGRKNLLWISSSFPIMLDPSANGFENFRDYQPQMETVANALGEAKVAVYPMDPAGLETPAYFQANSRNPSRASDALGRESQTRIGRETTMDVLASQTGGSICVNDNDLGDCIRRAMDDSSAFYEIAYYPDSKDWNGEFRKITVKTTQPGLHLSYRQGYFANGPATEDGKAAKAELQQAACEDYLNATSVLFSARSLPPDSPEKLKFYLAIDPRALTFTPAANGGSDLNINVAVCTFGPDGKARQLMSNPMNRTLTAKEYQAILSMGKLPHMVEIPGPTPAAVRLVVRDIPSGRMGSIRVTTREAVASAAEYAASKTPAR